jgi:hypothetical protein
VEGEGRGTYEEGGGEATSLGTLLYRERAEWRARGVAPMRREEERRPPLGLFCTGRGWSGGRGAWLL